MKIALRITLICLVALFSVISANAQKKAKKAKISLEDKVRTEVNQIAEAMELDDATAEKVYEINLETAQEVKDIQDEYRAKKKAGEEIDVEEKKARIKAVWKTANPKLKALLGKEQFKVYQETRKEVRAANKKK